MSQEIEGRQGNVHASPPLDILAIVFTVLFNTGTIPHVATRTQAPQTEAKVPVWRI